MRIVLTFLPLNPPLRLPLHYNYILQSFIYNSLEKSIAKKIHEEGFPFQKRKFRLFTFSRLLSSQVEIREEEIIFPHTFVLKISSLHTPLLESLLHHILKNPQVHLHGSPCLIESVEVEPKISPPSRPVQVKTLSPITVYSTLYTREGKRKTYYYTPWEKEFSSLILENLRKKIHAFRGENIPYQSDNHYIKPLRVSRRDEKIVKYKGTIIKGWMGIYELYLPMEYFPFAYHAGLGSKNSQGFGMIEITEKS